MIELFPSLPFGSDEQAVSRASEMEGDEVRGEVRPLADSRHVERVFRFGNRLENTEASGIAEGFENIRSRLVHILACLRGLDDVKEELRQDIVKPMTEKPEKATKFDIPLPNVLLYGPPGTGKPTWRRPSLRSSAFRS